MNRVGVWIAAVVLSVACWANSALAVKGGALYHVGQTSRVFHPGVARHWRGALHEGLTTTIWYPINASVPEVEHDIGAPGQPIFRGHAVAIDAPLSAAQPRYPLLLLSHGTGGTVRDLDWLAAALAAHGYIVAGTNHPGNNAIEPLTRDGFTLWWERAPDVSEVLDGVLADPKLAPHIDADRIGAMGFSLGGYTVLELAGARTNFPAFVDFCRSPAADAICTPPEMSQPQAAAASSEPMSPQSLASIANAGASYRDRRIKAVFAIAPALGEAFDAGSFAEVQIPVSLLAGTADLTVPLKTNIRRIAGFLPSASVTMLPGAGHYTFLDTCLPAAIEQLAQLCKDNPDVDRDAIHEQTVRRVVDFFASTLAAKPR